MQIKFTQNNTLSSEEKEEKEKKADAIAGKDPKQQSHVISVKPEF